jgi:hypothetical protein
VDSHTDSHLDRNGHAHAAANGYENPNDDTTFFANGHKRPDNVLPPFANGHQYPNDTLPLFADGHEPPRTDEHTDLDPGSDFNSDANEPSHQYTCNHGDQLSYEHCGGDKNRHRDTFAHTDQQARNPVANRFPDLDAPGSYGHPPARDGNRNPDRLESAS